MVRVSGIVLPCTHTQEDLERKVCRLLGIRREQLTKLRIVRRSLDARKKPALFFVYTADVSCRNEGEILRKKHGPEIMKTPDERYRFPEAGDRPLNKRPVIMGMGPAGLLCGYLLAKHGYEPLILERGGSVEERALKVEEFWKTGELDPETNVSFGEGGAGTFSDGKLNTLVKDRFFRSRYLLELFVRHGAPEEILFLQKPHIGTDVLRGVVRGIREEMVRLGAEVRFHAKLTELEIRNGRLEGVWVNGTEYIPCEVLVLAAGHSARDTFRMLSAHLTMEPKAFAVGLRIEHPQEMINLSQYGSASPEGVGAADYKLTYQAENGRGVYSVCMCPGGFVVNASTEEKRIAVNGMSNHARDGRNANSALIVTVGPEDFGGSGALAGIEFQRRLEEAAWQQGKGFVPVQLYGDFREDRLSDGFGAVLPDIKGAYRFGNLNRVLPEPVLQALKEAMPVFGTRIRGFDRPDAVFAGVESRTSSPLRIPRDETGVGSVPGIYPCGEGAGYAGGITSAAMDGMAAAEKIAALYRPDFNQ